MGQEIATSSFSAADFARFDQRLAAETELLSALLRSGQCSERGPLTGFELEAWLVDPAMQPAPRNTEFLAALNTPLACPELARFNVEFNNLPQRLEGPALSVLQRDLECQWREACAAAASLGLELLAIGILPTLAEEALHLGNISALNRYRALNEQILVRRQGRPLRLTICGKECLDIVHDDVMLEAATTSFQIHLQVPWAQARDTFNAALLASAPVVGVSCNSPFLFGRSLWAETRIPVFEQAVDAGDHGLGLSRVSFGSDFVRRDIDDVFQENLRAYPVLLPIVSETPIREFAHLRLHNGTIWRWNRALVGFDPDGTPHIRIEHRVVPAGPSIVDMIANAAFFHGLVVELAASRWDRQISFGSGRGNFYRAARDGLDALLFDQNGRERVLRDWVLGDLLERARRGLVRLQLDPPDIDRYLGIIERRVATGRTGCHWQRRYLERHPGDFVALTRAYLEQQRSGEPVHRWPL